MAYRELFVVEIREVLRLWQAGLGHRRIAALVSVDRKTVRRYVHATEEVRRGTVKLLGSPRLATSFGSWFGPSAIAAAVAQLDGGHTPKGGAHRPP